MKGVLIMGMFQDLNRISIAKQMSILYKSTSEIILSCRESEQGLIITGISSIQDSEKRVWDISAKIYNTKQNCIVENMLSLKCQPLDEIVAQLCATSVTSPEKIDLGTRRIVSCVGNKDRNNDVSIYFLAVQ